MPFENIYQCLIRTLTCCCFSLQLCAQTGKSASGTLNIPTFPDHSSLRPDIASPREDTLTPVVFSERPAFVIGEIIVTGNKKTKDYVIERELPFKTGDSVNLTELVKQFEIARQQLINTKLFIEAIVALSAFRGYTVDILIDVKERWYLFPLPYLKPIDRNLTEWAKQGYGTDRLNYGFKFSQYNFSGRNDRLRLWLVTGYTKQIQFQYDQPYADRTLKHGYKLGVSYSANKEVNYATVNNQQQFSDSFSGITKWSGNVEYNYRPGLRTFHALRFGFTRMIIDEKIAQLNPKYYHEGVNKIDIPEISYTLNHYNVDYIPYPLKGWMGEASLLRKGIHPYSEMWQLGAKYNVSFPLGNKFYFNWQAQGMLRLPFDQPFYNTQLFGYGDFYLRGLEKYVVDGVAGAMGRQTLRKQLFDFSLPTFLGSKAHARIPIRIFAKIFTDAGYSLNKSARENSLVNQMMYTAGGGLDLISFYDFTLRVDYSFNQLGQNGLFLHLKNDF